MRGRASLDTYFSAHPDSLEHFFQFPLEYQGRTHVWTSAPGIFQHRGLDVGTALLLDCAAEIPGQRILDLGCGHGPLGLLHLLRRPGARAWLVDRNARACEAARRNRDRLGASALVVHGDGASCLPDAGFDLVLTNPPIRAGLGVLRLFWRDAARVLLPGGNLVFVGRPRQGGRRLAELAAEQLGGAPERLGRRKGYEVFRVGRC